MIRGPPDVIATRARKVRDKWENELAMLGSEVRPGAGRALLGWLLAWWQPALAEFVQLRSGGHLLSEKSGLDAVEQAFQPADELSLGNPQLRFARRIGIEREGEAVELARKVGRQSARELADGRLVDLFQARAACDVERRLPHFFQ